MCSAFIPMSLGFNVKVSDIKQPSIIGNGRTFYVGGSGPDNYTTIQSAINHAKDGDTVFVYDESSSYDENIEIDNEIFLLGESRGTTIINGSGIGNVVTIIANNATISGFTIQNGGSEYENAGIYTRSDNIIIINNNIKSHQSTGIIIGEYSKDNTISGNEISHNNIHGIRLYRRSKKNNITNNIFSKNSWSGIFLVSSPDNVIKDNNFYKNGLPIQSHMSRGTYIEDNYFDSNADIWLFDSNHYNVITNNTIINSNHYGLETYNSNYLVISNNIISNNQGGIELLSNYCDIFNNTITNNNGKGLFLDGGDKNIISSNNISNNNHGLYLDEYAKENIISDNVFFNNYIYLHPEAWYPNTFSNNTVNGKPFIFMYEESDKSITGEVGQIILLKCNNITCYNLDLSNQNMGIQALRTNNCEFKHNRFSNDVYGIYLKGSNNKIYRNDIINNDAYGICIIGSNNKIYRNDILNNKNGLYWRGVSNLVEENNFIGNKVDARFHLGFGKIYTTRWIRNYWDEVGRFVKIISGRKDFKKLISLGHYDEYFSLPWLAIEWFPAKKAYHI